MTSEDRKITIENPEFKVIIGDPISLNTITSASDLQCKYCNNGFSPYLQKINLHGYCKPCCLDNHIQALKAQVTELEKYQKEIYGEEHEYYKDMGWI